MNPPQGSTNLVGRALLEVVDASHRHLLPVGPRMRYGKGATAPRTGRLYPGEGLGGDAGWVKNEATTSETITVEREIKFEVDPHFDLPDLRPVVGKTRRLPEQTLRTTYFGTEDMRLGRQGMTLCHRELISEGDFRTDDGPRQWDLDLAGGDQDTHAAGARPSRVSWPGAAGQGPKEALRV
jgi:hypothetical protein